MVIMAVEWMGGDFVAIAAILVGGIVSLVAVTMTGRNDEKARKDQRRFEVYPEIHQIVFRITGQASDMAITPGLTRVPDPDQDEVRKAESVLKLIGSKEVRNAFRGWASQLGPYWTEVWFASQARQKADALIDSATDDRFEEWQQAQSEAEMKRIGLSGPMSEIEKAAARLEEAMRAEFT